MSSLGHFGARAAPRILIQIDGILLGLFNSDVVLVCF